MLSWASKLSKVYIVGAGPGELWLMPSYVQGLLLSAVVQACPCEKVYVGKRRGRHAMKQEEINELMLKLAREGKTVVRLKGGDPFVLGRGEEECLFLIRNGIECKVLPGPSSATAVPTCANLPITHRGLANTFAVLTGQHAEGSKRPKYKEIAKVVDTLVILMGVGKAEEIGKEIAEVKDTWAAIIQNGCTSLQRTGMSKISKLGELAKALQPPAVIVIGEVVKWAYDNGLFRPDIVI